MRYLVSAALVAILLLNLAAYAQPPPVAQDYAYLDPHCYNVSHPAPDDTRYEQIHAIFPTDESEQENWEILTSTLEQTYQLVRALSRGVQTEGVVTRRCLDLLIRLICMQALQTCGDAPSAFKGSGVYALPSYPCYPMCTEVRDNCTEEITEALIAIGQESVLSLVIPDCDGRNPPSANESDPSPTALQPKFPSADYDWQANWTFVVSGFVIPWNVTCSVTESMTQPNFTCYKPLVPVEHDRHEIGYCDMECPVPVYEGNLFDHMVIFQSVVSWVGWLMSLLLFLTMMFLPRYVRYRHYPANLVVWMVLASHMICFGFMFPSLYGVYDLICKDANTYSNYEDHACVFQTLNFLYCAVSLPIFWAAIAVNSWLAIFLKKDRLFKTHGQLMEAITHIIAWVWPAVNCIILIAVKKAGGVSTITFCWIRGSNTTDFNWDYPLFFGPVCLLLLIGSLSILMVLYEMRNLRAAAGKRRYSKHIRLIAFLVVFWGVYSFVITYRFYAEDNRHIWVQDAEAWVICATLGPTVGESMEEYLDRCHRGRAVNVGVYWTFLFFGCGQAILLSLLFGSNPDIIEFWKERFRNVREGRSFFEGVTSAYTSAASQASKGSASTGDASTPSIASR